MTATHTASPEALAQALDDLKYNTAEHGGKILGRPDGDTLTLAFKSAHGAFAFAAEWGLEPTTRFTAPITTMTEAATVQISLDAYITLNP